MLNISQLEQFVEQAMVTAKVPGAALAIVHERKLIYARGFGVTSIEPGGSAVMPGTIFRIGSSSKPLTTTAIMRLVEAGQLELDTPIDEILPDLEFSVPGVIREVTLRKLLSHTAALPTAAEHYGSREVAGLRAGVYGDIAGYPLIAPVGKIWSYSNPGINLAGYLAEFASGKPYAQLMQELVFSPLKMTRTTFDPTVAMTYPLAQSHHSDADGNLVVDHHYADNAMHYPSGFVMSTVLDLANFAIMNLSGGSFEGQQLLKPESVTEMHTPHVWFKSLSDDGYGLTFSSFNYKGIRQVGHGGRISSFASHFELVPETGSAVIILANNSEAWGPHEGAITRLILDQLLDLPAEEAPLHIIEPDRSTWERLIGSYAGVISGAAEVVREGDALKLVWQGQPLTMQAVEPDLYVALPPAEAPGGAPLPVSFTFAADASPAEYAHIVIEHGYSLALKRLDIDPKFQPETATFVQYAGFYDAGFASLTVRVEDGVLVVSSPLFQNADLPAKPVSLHRFLLPVGLLTFEPPDAVLLGASLRFKRQAAPEPT
ncbi:MAG: beta-lactamase family protein [Anaerolineae bacterium]|nr:beta-lactamase family protein [Anaerolineae bacterium]